MRNCLGITCAFYLLIVAAYALQDEVTLKSRLPRYSPEDEIRIRKMQIEHKMRMKGVEHVIDPSLPASFDGRTAWPGCIHPVLNQGQCNSCWAFAASESLSDRFCIYSKGKMNFVLSPENLVSCEELNLGCSMGSLPGWAWECATKYGIATMQCVPYTLGNGGSVPSCQSKCADGSAIKHYKASNFTHVGSVWYPSSHVSEIMRAVTQGPVDVTFNVYADFDGYTGGVYKHKSGSYEGLHSVKVIGYGTENGQDYWLVQNSWGTTWGLGGYFKIARGVDECSIEALVYTGFPLL